METGNTHAARFLLIELVSPADTREAGSHVLSVDRVSERRIIVNLIRPSKQSAGERDLVITLERDGRPDFDAGDICG